ncbi:MAG: hypothetical protein IJ564_03360 [Alphaproteobacteria bacterium]|nr:hypothetical protein [Alphaproteobacteria bacterium]
MKKIIKTILWKIWDFYVKYYQFMAILVCILFAFEMQFIFALRNVGEFVYVIALIVYMRITSKIHLTPEAYCLGLLIIMLLYLWYIWEPLSSGEIWHLACREIFCF